MLTRNRIGALVMLAISIAYGALSTDITLLPFQRDAAFTARTMPQALAVIGVVLSFILLFTPSPEHPPEKQQFAFKNVTILVLLMIAYGLSIRSLGFILSTNVFLIGGFLVLGERRWLTMILMSVPLVVGFWLLMDIGLGVHVQALPEFLNSGT